MRVFLDANVLFSAAKSDGAVRKLVLALLDAGQTCCANSYVVEEARRNLGAKYPGGLPFFAELVEKLEVGGLYGKPTNLEIEIDLSDKDTPVLYAAIGMKCDTLVTGDSTHFGLLFGQDVAGVLVLSPAMLVDRLSS